MLELTTNQKGAIAEAAVVAAAAKLGIDVARPMWDVSYDLILDLHGRLLRVQCKWAIRVGDIIYVRCRRCRRGKEGLIHRGYSVEEIDAVAAYCPDVDRCYLIPQAVAVGQTAVSLRLTPARNNQREKIRWAETYEFAATLSSLGPIAQLGER